MDIKENIKNLLATDISSYEINRQTGVTRQLVDKYRKEPETVGKLTLNNALALNKYWEELQMKKLFKVGELNNGYFNYDEYELEFENGWIRNIPASSHPEAATDEYYWDNQDNIDKAIEEGHWEFNQDYLEKQY